MTADAEITGRGHDTLHAPADENELEERLSRPTDALVADFSRLRGEGDFLILGAGGKMGPTLARMARRALDAVQNPASVIAVARFSDPSAKAALEASGVRTIAADLGDQAQVQSLPEAANVVFMAGQKFGTTGAPEQTWRMNAYVPALVAERFAPTAKRIVVFSTGCVYPNVPIASGGSRETDELTPLGEYANSCVARERLFTALCQPFETPVLHFRLNYAVDLRYGVLVDIARKVRSGQPIDLATGYANVLWQGDANAYALRSLLLAQNPSLALNVTGPETLSIRELAHQFGRLWNYTPQFTGTEADTALLSNASHCHSLLGYPALETSTLQEWVGDWLQHGGRLLNKPTHYETRDGKY